MSDSDDPERKDPQGSPVNRRDFIKTASLLGAITVATPSFLTSIAAAAPQAAPAAGPPTEEDLKTFMSLSEALTGVALDPAADRILAREYFQRCLAYPEVGEVLPSLLAAYKSLGGAGGKDPAAISSRIMADPKLKSAAHQIIYLWYVSAFFDGKQWHYGPPEHYDRALVWTVIRAKAPMTQGGSYGYWAKPPIE